jgi:aminoglycoside phosphotransferase (APT) family kinase protein
VSEDAARSAPGEPSPGELSPGGLDPDRLGDWLAQHCGLVPPVAVTPVAGGRSNLTSIVIDRHGRRVVVRRPPLSGVLASAHDVVREGTIMAALAPTGVPVPEVLGSEEDSESIGAPFLVMAHVDGAVVRDEPAAAAITPSQRHALGVASARTLAAVHAVDVDAVALGGLARRDGYLARQLARWAGQLERGSDRPLPMLEEVARRLGAALPEQDGVALVHGDFRLDNLMVDTDAGSVLAVLDWELATLGDPLADLGTLVAYWGVPAGAEGRAATVLLPGLPTALAGFPGPGELVAAYADARGIAPDVLAERLRPYLAFAWFRIACILEGVRVRTAAGAYGGTGTVNGGTAGPAGELELLHDLVPALGERAVALLGRSGPLGFDHELT